MFSKKSFAFAGFAAGLLAFAGIAGATSYTLNVPNGLNYGTVTTSESLGVVTIEVQLSSGYNFVDTGSHHLFAFNYNGSVTPSIVSPTSGYTVASGTVTQSGFGDFSNGIECSVCQGQTNTAVPNDYLKLIFSGSLANFINNADGFMFTADLYGPSATGGNLTFPVGNGTPTVPEPATLALLGLGLLGVGAARRRRA